jgi:hypothetical protein
MAVSTPRNNIIPHVGEVVAISHIDVWAPGNVGAVRLAKGKDNTTFHGHVNFHGNACLMFAVYGAISHCPTCACRNATYHVEMLPLTHEDIQPHIKYVARESTHIAEIHFGDITNNVLCIDHIVLK